MLTMMVFNDFRWCLSKTFHRTSFFHLAEVSCFQIQTEFQIDGTCGKLRDAYQAGYSVLLKSLWFEKTDTVNRQAGSMPEFGRHVRCFCHMWSGWISLSSLEILDSQHKSSWLCGYTRNGSRRIHMALLTLWPTQVSWNFDLFIFLRGGSIISDSCSSIWRLVKYDNLTPRKFVASTCPKRKPTWPCFIRFSPPGSDLGSCVDTKLGYMKAPKNMTLEKYLNISFPAPIRKQKKSTWSLFLCLYDRSVC